jgi:hypothetical protein
MDCFRPKLVERSRVFIVADMHLYVVVNRTAKQMFLKVPITGKIRDFRSLLTLRTHCRLSFNQQFKSLPMSYTIKSLSDSRTMIAIYEQHKATAREEQAACKMALVLRGVTKSMTLRKKSQISH